MNAHETIIKKILFNTPILAHVTEQVHARGGAVYLVGGLVRDILLDLPLTQDLDIEVHGLELAQLEELLRTYGHVSLVGKSFGVLKIPGVPIDWSLPRLDSAGRKPQVKLMKDLPISHALRRRDLTMNAMAIDLYTLKLHDPFGGLADMNDRILRSPDPQFFTEDPLRFYRVMQFIGRFEMYPDNELQQVCATMDISHVSRERIEQEFNKLFLRSRRPSLGIRWLTTIGRLKEILPELAATQGIVQEPEWHPEGDVFEHSLQALDAAAGLEFEDDQEKLLIMYAALCHDLGKAITTRVIEGRIRSYDHEVKGAPLALALMRRITCAHQLQQTVALLVRHHMAPGHFVKGNVPLGPYKRLAFQLAPHANLRLLSLLAYADCAGRNPAGNEPLRCREPIVVEFVKRAQQAGVFLEPEPPVLTGADLIDLIPPGPALGAAVKQAYKIQIEKGITDKDQLIRRVKSGLTRNE